MSNQVLSPSPGPSDYLSPTQLSRHVPYTPKALEAMRARRIGPPWIICGRRVVYKWSDVVAWLEGGRQ